MSLAAVSVSPQDFDQIHAHLMSRSPRYQNMHLRKARWTLARLGRLHAMHAAPNVIEGVLSGPDDVFRTYSLFVNVVGSGTQ